MLGFIDSWALSLSLGSFQSNQQSLCDVSFLQVDSRVKYRKRGALVLYTNVPTRKCTKQLSLQLIYSREIDLPRFSSIGLHRSQSAPRHIYGPFTWAELRILYRVSWSNEPGIAHGPWAGWSSHWWAHQIKWTGPAHSAPYLSTSAPPTTSYRAADETRFLIRIFFSVKTMPRAFLSSLLQVE